MGAPDLGEIRGDPWAIRGCAADLRSVIGALGPARTAAANIESALGGSSWSGDAYDALVEQAPDRPSSADIDNASSNLERGASVLDTLAREVEDCQLRLEHCRLRLSALLVDGEVPPELEGEVDRIVNDAEEVRDDHRRALAAAAGAFDEMDDLTVYAQPPPGLMEQVGGAIGGIARFTGDFVTGIVEGVVEIVAGLAQLAYYLGTPMGWMAMWENRDQIVAVVQYAIENPGDFAVALGQAMIDWDTLTEDPARWLGKLVPNILLAVFTGGAGNAAGRLSAVSARMARFPRATTALNRAATGLNTVDRVGGLARLVPGLRYTPGGLHMELRARPHWTPEQLAAAQRKVDHLEGEAQVNALRYTDADRRGLPSQRTIWENAYGPTPDGMQIDHKTDLQLGGRHELANFEPLDSTVNMSLGPQLNNALSGVTGSRGVPWPYGTSVTRVTLSVGDGTASATFVRGGVPGATAMGIATTGVTNVTDPEQVDALLGCDP